MVERDNRPPSMSVPLTVGALSLLTTLALCASHCSRSVVQRDVRESSGISTEIPLGQNYSGLKEYETPVNQYNLEKR